MNRKPYGRIRMLIAAAFLFVFAACIVGGGRTGAFLSAIQPGPTWGRLAAETTVAGVALVVGLLAATVVFGRFFCAALCPLGTVQDGIGMLRPGNAARVPNFRAMRYIVAVASLFLLAGGWSILFRYLDPFSRFGGIVQALSGLASPSTAGVAIGGLLSLAAIAALVVWKKRIYCTSLCPVGTVLGICARWGIYRLRFVDACSGCGLCQRVCPTDCIDSRSRLVDGERCLLCLRCVSVCPGRGLAYVGKPRSDTVAGDGVADSGRRGFLVAGAAAALGAAGAGFGFSGTIRGLARAAENADGLILPPGAGDAERFARQCTSCQMCTMGCPAGVITPSPYGFGPVRVDYSRSGCQYDCVLCGSICPSGALRRLELTDKQWLKIGEAVFDAPKCRVIAEGVACTLCAAACPKDAIFMMEGPNGLDVPEVAAFHCIGCGACQAACPVRPKAIAVKAIEQRPMGG